MPALIARRTAACGLATIIAPCVKAVPSYIYLNSLALADLYRRLLVQRGKPCRFLLEFLHSAGSILGVVLRFVTKRFSRPTGVAQALVLEFTTSFATECAAGHTVRQSSQFAL